MTNTVNNAFKQTSRLSELWDDLLSDPVPFRPAANKRMTAAARFGDSDPVSPPFTPDMKRPSVPGKYKPNLFPDATRPVTDILRNGLGRVLHTLLELENAEPAPLSMDPANSEPEAFSEMSIEAAHEEALSLISPFRWDPRPAWTNTPIQQRPPLSNAAVPHPPVTRPKIPLRPLHKRPFYKRFFFSLHHWLSRPK